MGLREEWEDWWGEPQNIERISRNLDDLVSLIKSRAVPASHSVSPATHAITTGTASGSGTASGMVPRSPTISLADFWIVGPAASDTTVPLRLARDPSVGVTLSSTLVGLLQGMVVVFISGPDNGFVTTIASASREGVLTIAATGYKPREGDRLMILSSIAASTQATNQQKGNSTNGHNTVSIPSGVDVNIDVPGQFSHNTITITKNNTGLPTTIQANSMTGSNIALTEGDTFVANAVTATSVVSTNKAGGLTGTGSDHTSFSFSNPGTTNGTMTLNFDGTQTDYQGFLQAGGSGTVTILISEDSTLSSGTFQLDNGSEHSFPNGGGTYTLEIPTGSHVLYVHFSSNFDGDTVYDHFQFSDWTDGDIVQSLSAASYIRVGNMANSGIIVDGDSVVIRGNDIANSQVINKGIDITGSNVVIDSNMSDSNIFWYSKMNLTVGSMHGATITVPTGVKDTTVIAYSGEVAEDLTTTVNSTVYVGTTLIPGYTPTSSDPTVVENSDIDRGFVARGQAAAYDTLTIQTYYRIDGELAVNDLVVKPGATTTLGTDGRCLIGAFN